MSKNQLKKLRKKKEWEAGREDRKVLRKEQQTAKRQRKKENYAKAIAEGGEAVKPAPKKFQERAVQVPITILIDCDFDDLMRDNERKSLEKQITRAYSDNKLSKYRVHLTICSFGGNLMERFDGLLEGMYKNWRGTRFLTENFVNAAEKAKGWMCAADGGRLKGVFEKYADVDDAVLKEQAEVIYLSSEAEETLTELKPYSTYMIGGLVDKNREKGICYKRATAAGVRTAKLPIGEYLDMSSRKVLATNHVNEIMLKWIESGDWADAFIKVIPKRKGGQLKTGGGQQEENEQEGDESGVEGDVVVDSAATAITTPATI